MSHLEEPGHCSHQVDEEQAGQVLGRHRARREHKLDAALVDKIHARAEVEQNVYRKAQPSDKVYDGGVVVVHNGAVEGDEDGLHEGDERAGQHLRRVPRLGGQPSLRGASQPLSEV